MTNNSVTLTGYILDSNLINPKTDFFGSKYLLSLHPDNYSDLAELEHRIEDLKREAMMSVGRSYGEYENEEHTDEYIIYSDCVIDGCSVTFQSIHSPNLLGNLSTYDDDHQLMGKYVRCLGHLKQHKGGNVWLSIHEVMEFPEPNVEDYDFIEDGDNDF